MGTERVQNLGAIPPRVHFDGNCEKYKVVRFLHPDNRHYPTVVGQGRLFIDIEKGNQWIVEASDGLHYPTFTDSLYSAQAHAEAVELRKHFICGCCGDTGYLAYSTEMPCGWCELGASLEAYNASLAAEVK